MSHALRLTIALCLYRQGLEADRAVLSAVLPAISDDSSVELLVLDNNPDADRHLIKSLVRDNIRYLPNDVNLGMPGSHLRAWSEARGQYVIILGDDDYLDPFFVEKVIQANNLTLSDDYDIVASSPTEFESAGLVRRLARNEQDVLLLSAATPQERVQASMNWRYLNYLFYSAFRRDRVILDTYFYFTAYCPGYITGLDWTVSDGFALCHQIKQLDYGYYIYNRANWAIATQKIWVQREIDAFKQDLIPELGEVMPDAEVFALQTMKLAAVATAYFHQLGQAYHRAYGQDFDLREFYNGAVHVLKNRYLVEMALDGVSLADLCQPTPESLSNLIGLLCNTLSPGLKHGKELADFLIPRGGEPMGSNYNDLISAYKRRSAGGHHAPVD